MTAETKTILDDLNSLLAEQETPEAPVEQPAAPPQQAAPPAQAPPAQQVQQPAPMPRPRSTFLVIANWLTQQDALLKRMVMEMAALAESGTLVRQEYEEVSRVVAGLRQLSGQMDQTKTFTELAARRLDPTTPKI